MSLNNAIPIEKVTPELLQAIEAASIWRPASVTKQPEVTLLNWQIVEATFDEAGTDKSRHFIGTNATEGYSGRVSSAIVEFDQERMTGKTRSGRVYKLSGPPGVSGNGNYVWDVWANRNQVLSTEDVTTQYWDVSKASKSVDVELEAAIGGGSGG